MGVDPGHRLGCLSMRERRSDQAADVDLPDALWPFPSKQGVLLQESERVVNGGVVGAFDITATCGSATAHSVDTDFTGEKVRSKPATVCACGRECFAIVPASSRASVGGRPCSAANNSRATSVRILARSAGGTGQSVGSPACSLNAAIRFAGLNPKPAWFVDDLERHAQPGRCLRAGVGQISVAELLQPLRRQRMHPAPNRARICSTVTGSPAFRPSMPAIPGADPRAWCFSAFGVVGGQPDMALRGGIQHRDPAGSSSRTPTRR